MKARLFAATLIGLMFASFAGLALASDDCPRTPREQWKPEAEARSATEAMGYKVNRISAGDGCYEVQATDKRGKAVEVKFNLTDMKLVSRQFKSDSALASR